MGRTLSAVAASALLALTLGACASDGMTGPGATPDFSGNFSLLGQVVRDDAPTMTPIEGVTLNLYAPADGHMPGAVWVDIGAGTSFFARHGFWGVRVASGRTAEGGTFRLGNVRSGTYVLRVVPDVLRGCSTGATMSVQLGPLTSTEPLLVRAR
jgi:hypothetical protein